VAINGFGRVGRAAFRAAYEADSRLEFVAINDVADAVTLAYLLGRSASGSLGAIGFAALGVAALVYLATRVRRRLHAGSRRPPPAQRPEEAP